MERVTNKDLYIMVDALNELKPMDGAKFALDFAYGGVRLVKRYTKTGGESDLSLRGTRREIYDQMRCIEAYMLA